MDKQWYKVPVGTKFWFAGADKAVAWDEADRATAGAVANYPGEGAYIDPREFADVGKRIALGNIGFYSVDDPDFREKRRQQLLEEARRISAYRALGVERGAVHASLAAEIEGHLFGGIWARSTAEYAKKREALDNAFLYAAGVTNFA